MSKDQENTTDNGTYTSETNPEAIARFKNLQHRRIDVDAVFKDIIDGKSASLSKGITLIESVNQKHAEKAQSLIEKCLPYANTSIRIGITGVPGVGKSTFIEAFGNLLIDKGKKVAVLAVDPSSTVSGGSILGDKTRMESLVKSKNAFIRPSPAGNSLGGVAQKTRESIILCEAAGYDIIIIETVGVGQSEIAVHGMVDFFLLLKLAGAGDELQGIKRGIMEMADAVIINKADGANLTSAQLAKNQFQKALHLYPVKEEGWTPQVVTCSSLTGEGIEAVWQQVIDYISLTKSNGFFESNRKQQNKFWLLQTIEEELKSSFFSHPRVQKEIETQIKWVQQSKVTPFFAAKYLLNLHKGNGS